MPEGEAGKFSEPEERPLDLRLGVATKPHPEHSDRNEDRSFAMSPRGALVSTGTEGYDPDKEKRLASGIFAAGVFDGVGGYAQGDLAANELRKLVMETCAGTPLSSYPEFQGAMRKAWIKFEQNAGQLLEKKADTTGSVVWIFEQEGNRYAATAQTGDSRVYKLTKDGKITKLTQDHNMAFHLFGEKYPHIATFITDVLDRAPVAGPGWKDKRNELEEMWQHVAPEDQEAILEKLRVQLQSTGLPTENIAKTTMPLFDHFWMMRNITQGARTTNPTFGLHELAEGDRVILTSDGLSDPLTTDEIKRVSQGSGTAQEKAQELVMHAYETSKFGPQGPQYRTKPDDVTAVVIG